jgi:hypothetical protein
MEDEFPIKKTSSMLIVGLRHLEFPDRDFARFSAELMAVQSTLKRTLDTQKTSRNTWTLARTKLMKLSV